MKERAYTSLGRPKLEYRSSAWDPHTKYPIHQVEMVQREAAKYTCNIYHNTSSVTEMLQRLNWPTLEKRRIRTRIIFFYKIRHYLVTHLLTPSGPRARQYPYMYFYRLIQTTQDSYKYSFFPRTIAQWNLLHVAAVQCTPLDSF